MAPDSAIAFAYHSDWSVHNKTVHHSNSMFSIPPPAAFYLSDKSVISFYNQCPENVFVRRTPVIENKWKITYAEKK